MFVKSRLCDAKDEKKETRSEEKEQVKKRILNILYTKKKELAKEFFYWFFGTGFIDIAEYNSDTTMKR